MKTWLSQSTTKSSLSHWQYQCEKRVNVKHTTNKPEKLPIIYLYLAFHRIVGVLFSLMIIIKKNKNKKKQQLTTVSLCLAHNNSIEVRYNQSVPIVTLVPTEFL